MLGLVTTALEAIGIVVNEFEASGEAFWYENTNNKDRTIWHARFRVECFCRSIKERNDEYSPIQVTAYQGVEFGNMSKKITLFLFLCAFAAFFAFGMRANASVPIDVYPWEIELEDNKVFYMTPPQLPSQGTKNFLDLPDISEERMQIKSGLYYNEEPLRNIYYIDISAHKHHVFISDCGIYLVTLQDTLDNFNGEILGGGLINFFGNGNLIKSYGAKDLLRYPDTVPETSAGYFWRYDGSTPLNKEANFDQEANTLTVDTYTRDVFVFDIKTGEIVSDAIPGIPTIETDEIIDGTIPGIPQDEAVETVNGTIPGIPQHIFFISIGIGIVACVAVLFFIQKRRK